MQTPEKIPLSNEMTNTVSISSNVLTPPRAAAVAGVVFSVLMVIALGIVRVAAIDPSSPTTWLNDPVKRAAFRFAINLVPFAGIAFLWFIGVLRNRLGRMEDQFFTTVFLGSGLLFVASLFAATAIAGALLQNVAGSSHVEATETSLFAQRVVQAMLNVFAIKMAAMFMFSICTIALRTGILTRWLAVLGFACGLTMLLVIGNWKWVQLLFPVWMLLISVHILLTDLRPRHD